jgi:hypothetical protein
LFAKESCPEVIAALASQLNDRDNPSMDGHIFEWLFFASVRIKSLVLFNAEGKEEILPMAQVITFDPKRNFKKLWNLDGTFEVSKSKFWLKPVQWNQGGYDAVYIDSESGSVTFVQLTISHQHDFKMRFFNEVLNNLQATTNRTKSRSQSFVQWKITIYFIVKQRQLAEFRITHVDDRNLLVHFDKEWKQPEEDHVTICAIKGSDKKY